ncbi:MAG: alpha-hydroxy-acid oxidizing protein [Gemmatimonadota bacterium]|nr:alpha-hydroxy-acid oxidizing protein [Gemmatimonadota bacterium]
MLDIVNLESLELLAEAALPRMVFDYIAGGGGDEWTLRENREAFSRIQLMPRVLRGIVPRLETTVLGTPISFPVLVAPMAMHGLVCEEAEPATARATAAAGTIMVASTVSNRTLEEIAESSRGPRWFQLYIYRDRGVTRDLVERARAAGYGAICLTVDTPLAGQRDRDKRNAFTMSPVLTLANFAGHETPLGSLDDATNTSGLSTYIATRWDQTLTWDDVSWLREISPLPIVVKGILSPEDAKLAVERGAAAIIVSNHGGRQLDGVPATISVLRDVSNAVNGACEVLLDGGVRRGTDVLKALALGARAVLLGRPVLWGLTLDGESGARAVLEHLRAETALAMGLAGCASVAELSEDLIWRGASAADPGSSGRS